MHEPKIDVTPNDAQSRYDVTVDGAAAGFAAYRREGERMVFTHTEVDPSHEGEGVGSKLIRGALDDARRNGARVVAQCPFVSAFIDKHEEYADLLDE